MKNPLTYTAITFIALILLVLFLQTLMVPLLGGIGGSFGLRPQNHSCIGITLKQNSIDWLPKGNIEFNALLHFRYYVPPQFSEKSYCLGQDVWFGE